jgi:hypothetical protein
MVDLMFHPTANFYVLVQNIGYLRVPTAQWSCSSKRNAWKKNPPMAMNHVTRKYLKWNCVPQTSLFHPRKWLLTMH